MPDYRVVYDIQHVNDTMMEDREEIISAPSDDPFTIRDILIEFENEHHEQFCPIRTIDVKSIEPL